MRLIVIALVMLIASIANASDRHSWHSSKYRATQNYTCSDQLLNRTTYDLTLNRDGTFSSEGVGSYNGPNVSLTNYTFTCAGTWSNNRSQAILNETYCTVNEVNQYNTDGSIVPAISRGFPYQSNFPSQAVLQFPAYGYRTSFMLYGASDFVNEVVFATGTITRSCNGEGQGVRLSRKDTSEIEQPVPVDVQPSE